MPSPIPVTARLAQCAESVRSAYASAPGVRRVRDDHFGAAVMVDRKRSWPLRCRRHIRGVGRRIPDAVPARRHQHMARQSCGYHEGTESAAPQQPRAARNWIACPSRTAFARGGSLHGSRVTAGHFSGTLRVSRKIEVYRFVDSAGLRSVFGRNRGVCSRFTFVLMNFRLQERDTWAGHFDFHRVEVSRSGVSSAGLDASLAFFMVVLRFMAA